MSKRLSESLTRGEVMELVAAAFPDEIIREMFDARGNVKEGASEMGDTIGLFLVRQVSSQTSEEGNTVEDIEGIVGVVRVAINDLCAVRDHLEGEIQARREQAT